MNIPFLGWHLRLAGHVPVDRGAGASVAAEVTRRFEETLRRGKPLLVFPEGTRSEDGVVRSFKSGAFRAAARACAPVVPVALDGTHRLMRKGAIDTGDGAMRRVVVRIGTPLRAIDGGGDEERTAELRDRTRAAVVDLFGRVGGRATDDAVGDAARRARGDERETERRAGV